MALPRWLPPLAFAACCLIWGSTWLAIKVGYEGAPPFTAAALRFLYASSVLVLAALIAKSRLPLSGRPLGLAVLVGVLLFTFDYGLIYWGEQFLDSGLTAIVFATLPIQTAVLANFFIPTEKLTLRRGSGVALGFLGLVVIFNRSLSFDPLLLLPMLAIVLSATCASVSSVASKLEGKNVDVVGLNGVAMAIGGVLLLAWAFLAGEPVGVPSNGIALLSIGYLAVFGSIVTFMSYFWLLKTWDATTLSFIALITPVVALTLGVFVRGEAFDAIVLVGGALILGGIYLVSTGGVKVPAPEVAAK